MSLIACSLVLFAAHITAAPPPAPPPSPAGIVLDLDARVPGPVQRLAVEEASRVWAPYRVAVTIPSALPPGAGSPSDRAVLSVRLAGRGRRTTASLAPFASIRFISGRPEPVVYLHYEAIGRAIAGSVALGVREEQWPPALRDRVLGRIVGRVLAHEIGHFVLRSPRHASRGLMRPIQYIGELIAGDGDLFGLTAEDLSLLRAAMGLGSALDGENAGG
jgi:hypothetical protein